MYMKFLCEFWSAIETLVVIITEEKLLHCFYWWYGDPLLATSCHATEQICLVGVELPTSVCTCIIWIILTLLLNIGFTAWVYTWPVSCWRTKFQMEADIPGAASVVLIPEVWDGCGQCLEKITSGMTVFELDDFLLLTSQSFSVIL